MNWNYKHFVALSLFVGLAFVCLILLLYLKFNRPLPDGIQLASPYSKYSYLISDDINFDFDDQSNRFYSNILVGPYVEWVKYESSYIYGYNRTIGDPEEDISPEGFFLIDYPKGEIYYIDEESLEKILSGSSTAELKLSPDVTFSKDYPKQ